MAVQRPIGEERKEKRTEASNRFEASYVYRADESRRNFLLGCRRRRRRPPIEDLNGFGIAARHQQSVEDADEDRVGEAGDSPHLAQIAESADDDRRRRVVIGGSVRQFQRADLSRKIDGDSHAFRRRSQLLDRRSAGTLRRPIRCRRGRAGGGRRRNSRSRTDGESTEGGRRPGRRFRGRRAKRKIFEKLADFVSDSTDLAPFPTDQCLLPQSKGLTDGRTPSSTDQLTGEKIANF